MTGTFAGQVRLGNEERELGFIRVELSADAATQTWGGLILGSDYLMWGGNHRLLTIEFADGERSNVVIRATGRVIGQGEPPAVLTAS